MRRDGEYSLLGIVPASLEDVPGSGSCDESTWNEVSSLVPKSLHLLETGDPQYFSDWRVEKNPRMGIQRLSLDFGFLLTEHENLLNFYS